MGRPALTEVEEESAREEILLVARNIFASKGLEALTMRSVAEGVGRSPMWLYRFFPNKRTLLRNIWESIFVEVFEQVTRCVDASPDPISKLRIFAREYIRFWLDHPDEYRVIFLNEDEVTEANEQYYVYDSDTISRFDIAKQIIEDGMLQGVFLQGDAKLAMQQVSCLIHGVAHMLITVPEYPWLDQELVVEGSLQMMLRGLGASID